MTNTEHSCTLPMEKPVKCIHVESYYLGVFADSKNATGLVSPTQSRDSRAGRGARRKAGVREREREI